MISKFCPVGHLYNFNFYKKNMALLHFHTPPPIVIDDSWWKNSWKLYHSPNPNPRGVRKCNSAKNITTRQNYLSFPRGKSFLNQMLFHSSYKVSIGFGGAVFS